jgi:hypothetical protein
MTGDQRRRAAAALWSSSEATGEQAQAVLLIAKQMKSRPKTVAAMDAERKARYLASLLDLPDEIAARVLVLYHLADQRPMMGAFLDGLGITHDHGLIEEDAAAPDQSKIAPAAAALAQAFPADDVAVYLNTLLMQDPQAWAPLDSAPEAALPG